MATERKEMSSESSKLALETIISTAMRNDMLHKQGLHERACPKPPQKPKRRDSVVTGSAFAFDSFYSYIEEDNDNMASTDESCSIVSDFVFPDSSASVIFQSPSQVNLANLEERLNETFLDTNPSQSTLTMQRVVSNLNAETFVIQVPFQGHKSFSSLSSQSCYSFDFEDYLSDDGGPIKESPCPREEQKVCKSPPCQPQRRMSIVTTDEVVIQQGKVTEDIPYAQDAPPFRPRRRLTNEGNIIDRVLHSIHSDIRPNTKTSKPQYWTSTAGEEKTLERETQKATYSVLERSGSTSTTDAVVWDNPPFKPKRKPTHEKAYNLLEDEDLDLCIDEVFRTVRAELDGKEDT